MRILECSSAGAAWSLLSLSSQTFHNTQELMDRMQKHVARDGCVCVYYCVHGLCVRHAAFGWRIHCGVEVTESSTNKQHTP
jgi:hypothetical protein